MKTRLIALILISIISGCTIKQEFHFNQDYSGESINKIDLSVLKTVMKSSDTLNNAQTLRDSTIKYIEHISKKLSQVNGISGIKHGWQDNTGTAFLKYQFNNLENLNNAYDIIVSGVNQRNDKNYFSTRWNNLIFRSPVLFTDSIVDNKAMYAMKNYFHYNITMTFDKNIKKVRSKNTSVQSSKKTLKTSGNLIEVLSGKDPVNMKIKFE